MRSIRKIRLPIAGFDALVREASAEGFTFLEPVQEDWSSGRIRFDGPGEAFYGVFDEDELVGVGALSRDPFLNLGGVGRLRRIFVRTAWRNQGIGAELVATMLTDARLSFWAVRLRADNSRAAQLYERFGFTQIEDPNATHLLAL